MLAETVEVRKEFTATEGIRNAPSWVVHDKVEETFLHFSMSRAQFVLVVGVGVVCRRMGAKFRVAMSSKIERRKSANIADPVDVNSDFTNEGHGLCGAGCQAEPQDQRSEQDTGHLDQKYQHVILEHRLKTRKNFGIVGAVPPMFWQIVCVDGNTSHGGIGVKHTVLGNDERPRSGDDESEKPEPPEQVLSEDFGVEEERVLQHTQCEDHCDKCARNEQDCASYERQNVSWKLLDVAIGVDIALIDAALEHMRKLVEFAKFPQRQRSPFAETDICGRIAEFSRVSEEKIDEQEKENEGCQNEIDKPELNASTSEAARIMEEIPFDTKFRVKSKTDQVIQVPFQRLCEEWGLDERNFHSEDVLVNQGDEKIVVPHDPTDDIVCVQFLDNAEPLFCLQLHEFVNDLVPRDCANRLLRDGQIPTE